MSQTEPGKQPKFRRRVEARPDEVLDAALELFAAKGFAETRVEDVARAAGLSKGTVYLYFPSKTALLAGLVRRALASLATEMLLQLAEYRGDPRIVIRQVLGHVRTKLSDPQMLAIPKLVLREAVVAPEIARIYREEVLDRAIPALIALVAQGVEAGHIRKVDPELTVRSIVGPLAVHMLLSEIFDIRPADGLSLDRLIDNHLTILFAGLEPQAEPMS